MDQRGLVEQARRGDHDAFAVLAGAAVARLDTVARLIVRDRELARDAVQEALVRAWRDLPGLRDPDRFDAWLHRLTVRICIDEVRRRRRRVIEVELSPLDQPTTADGVSTLADRDELEHALDRLEPEQRAIVVLHYYLGMSMSDCRCIARHPDRHCEIQTQSRHRVAPSSDRRGGSGHAGGGREANGMNAHDGFDRLLTDRLADSATYSIPDYFDDVLAVTARTRQRPAWTFPGRWLPMADVARRPVFGASVPWRPIAILLIVAALMVAAAAAFVGSRGRLPAPFGVARNGLIAYENAGDIYTYDPATRTSSVLVGGTDAETQPVWSLDGTRLAFVRTSGTPAHAQLYVVGRDGRDEIAITAALATELEVFGFSPAGDEIAFTIVSPSSSDATLAIAKVDGSHLQMIDVGMTVNDVAYRPPDGREIAFVGRQRADDLGGLYAVDLASGDVRTIIAPSADRYLGTPTWSPDGSRIAYTDWDPTVDFNLTATQHVVLADGTHGQSLGLDRSAAWHVGAWSNDSSRLLYFGSGKTGLEDGWYATVINVDGGDTVALARPSTTAVIADGDWSPDDRSILGTPHDAQDTSLPHVMWDSQTGAVSPAAFDASATGSNFAWQRLAP